jgi:hypothetical protein
MSTGLIVAIVVIALILLVLFAVVLPRARRKAEVQARERELTRRRENRAEEHRTEAAERRSEAEMAEQRARMAQAEAERERAEAEIGEQRAQMHERGMADDELIDDNERDRFAGTSGVRDERATTTDDDRTLRDERATTTDDDRTPRDEDRPMHEPTGDYERGRDDEARERAGGRFDREPERTDEPTRSRPA